MSEQNREREYGSGRNMIEQGTSLPPGEYNFIEYKAYEKAVSALREIADTSCEAHGHRRFATQALIELGEEIP